MGLMIKSRRVLTHLQLHVAIDTVVHFERCHGAATQLSPQDGGTRRFRADHDYSVTLLMARLASPLLCSWGLLAAKRGARSENPSL